MKLTNTQCKNTKFNPDGKGNKISDGGGLFLHVKESVKYWRMNYRFLGKQKTLAIGPYPLITLKEARDKRDDAKRLILSGTDPSQKKKLDKLDLKEEHENSFENIACEWHKHKEHTWQPNMLPIYIFSIL